MKLSEELKQINDCGDVGGAVEGLDRRAKRLENKVDKLTKENDRLKRVLSGVPPHFKY